MKKRVQLLLKIEEIKVAMINAGCYKDKDNSKDKDKAEQSSEEHNNQNESGHATPKAQEEDNVAQ